MHTFCCQDFVITLSSKKDKNSNETALFLDPVSKVRSTGSIPGVQILNTD